MNKITKLNEWFSRHGVTLCFSATIFMVILCIYSIISLGKGDDSWKTISSIIVGAINAIVYTSYGISLLRKRILEKFLKSVDRELKETYFCGFSLERYIKSGAILRIESWAETGLCYELSVLAMILARHNKTAKICRGDCYSDGKFRTRHAWVEVKVPLNGWFIFDLAWASGLCKKTGYLNSIAEKNSRLICRWECGYSQFWEIRFSKAILKATRKSNTSYVLPDLFLFGDPNDGYDFKKLIYKTDDLIFFDGRGIDAHYRKNPNRPISSTIIRDFVKNPKRKNAKAKSIRIAIGEMRRSKNSEQ